MEKHKIADKWEDNPYLIIYQLNENIHVFTVRREDDEGLCKVLHRNLLLPIETQFPITDTSPSEPKPRVRNANRKDKEVNHTNVSSSVSDSESK